MGKVELVGWTAGAKRTGWMEGAGWGGWVGRPRLSPCSDLIVLTGLAGLAGFFSRVGRVTLGACRRDVWT